MGEIDVDANLGEQNALGKQATWVSYADDDPQKKSTVHGTLVGVHMMLDEDDKTRITVDLRLLDGTILEDIPVGPAARID